MEELSNPLIKPEDLLTQGGATLAVTVITNGLQYAFGLNPKYIGLIVSIVVVFGGASSSILSDFSIAQIIVAIVNTFFIYNGAVGLTTIVGGSDTQGERIQKGTRDTEEISSGRIKKFWTPWF